MRLVVPRRSAARRTLCCRRHLAARSLNTCFARHCHAASDAVGPTAVWTTAFTFSDGGAVAVAVITRGVRGGMLPLKEAQVPVQCRLPRHGVACEHGAGQLLGLAPVKALQHAPSCKAGAAGGTRFVLALWGPPWRGVTRWRRRVVPQEGFEGVLGCRSAAAAQSCGTAGATAPAAADTAGVTPPASALLQAPLLDLHRDPAVPRCMRSLRIIPTSSHTRSIQHAARVAAGDNHAYITICQIVRASSPADDHRSVNLPAC